MRPYISGGSKGWLEGRAPPPGPKFFPFHAFFWKIWRNRMLAPPRELAPPPRGNPRSATVYGHEKKVCLENYIAIGSHYVQYVHIMIYFTSIHNVSIHTLNSCNPHKS